MAEKIPAPMYATVQEVQELISSATTPEKLSEVLSKTTMKAWRAQGRGQRERLPAEVKISTSLKFRALDHFNKTVGVYIQGPMKEALTKELAKLSNMPSHTRTSARPMKIGEDAPDLQVQWRNTNPKSREKGRWVPYLMVPLNLYMESLGLKGPVQIGNRFVTTDAVEVSYKAKEIKVNLSKVNKTRHIENSDELNDGEDDENIHEEEDGEIPQE